VEPVRADGNRQKHDGVCSICRVGDRSRRQLHRSEPSPATFFDGQTKRAGAASVPKLEFVHHHRWDGRASFNGLTVEAKHRISHALSFDASYTLSHSIDDASDAGATNAEFNLPQNIYANNFAVEKASSSFDHRNRFVGNVLYDLPFAKGARGWVRLLAADWRASGVLIAQSGSPFTVNLSSSNDLANIGLVGGNNIERPQVIANPNAGPKTPQTWFNTAAFTLPAPLTFGNTPRNSVLGPGYMDLDTSLQKRWQVWEAMDLQFRVDVYNLLNHPNFNLPGRIFGTSNFGVISSALDPRQMQFALKLEF
jgi:hypothetical protein